MMTKITEKSHVLVRSVMLIRGIVTGTQYVMTI